MAVVCKECRAKVADGVMTCPVCGMPLKDEIDKIAFTHEWNAFVEGERILLERLKSNRETKASRVKTRDRLARVQIEWKNLLVRMCDAGVRPKDLALPKGASPEVEAKPVLKKSKKTESIGSTLPYSKDHSLIFIKGRIKIHPDKFHIWFNNIGWYEVGPNCSWKVLDRILDQSRNKPEYQDAPFTFSFSRLDGIRLGKAVAVDKGPAGTWLRKKVQIPLTSAVFDKNPGCETRHKLTTAAFKQIIYDEQTI